jgi:hypothetical protein
VPAGSIADDLSDVVVSVLGGGVVSIVGDVVTASLDTCATSVDDFRDRVAIDVRDGRRTVRLDAV